MKIVLPKQDYNYTGDMFILRDEYGKIEEAHMVIENYLGNNDVNIKKMHYKYITLDLINNVAIGLLKDNEEVIDEFRDREHISKNDIQITRR